MVLKIMKSWYCYFTKQELLLWLTSMGLIIVAFFNFDKSGYLTLVASLIGVTSLIFNAKGNPLGQFLMVIFSLLYGIISYSFAYYGEMMTYMGMTAFALVSWLSNPYQGNKAEVAINRLTTKEIGMMLGWSVVVTIIFYFILRFFHTTYLMLSTLSIATSFLQLILHLKKVLILHLLMQLMILCLSFCGFLPH